MYLVTRICGVFYTRCLSVWGAPLSGLNSPMGGRASPADRTELDHSKGRPGTSMSTDPVQGVLGAGMRPWGPGTGAIQVTRHSTVTRALATPPKSHRDLGWTPHISLPLAPLLSPWPPALVTLAFWWLSKCPRDAPASGPLHLLLMFPETCFFQIWSLIKCCPDHLAQNAPHLSLSQRLSLSATVPVDILTFCLPPCSVNPMGTRAVSVLCSSQSPGNSAGSTSDY